jgi:outer membrane lipoprotein-sorting protein
MTRAIIGGAAWLAGLALLSLAQAAPAAAGQEAVAPAGAVAAEPRPSPREKLSPELKMVLDRLDEASRKLKDVTARVTYERRIPMLDQKEKSQGTLAFKKPDLLSLKLGKPRNEEVHFNGKTWWVVSHDDKQVEVYQAAEKGKGAQEAAFLDFGYGSGADKLLEQYDVELAGTEQRGEGEERHTVYRLKFIPRPNPENPPRYEAIEVEVSDDLWLPQSIVLHESGGEIRHAYALSKLGTNADLKDEDFEYTPPRGYTVVRPQEF